MSEIKETLRAANAGQRASAVKSVVAATAALEASRDLTRVCAVVDLDMFFAAVEMRDEPSLRDKPMAVGGMGMISTANYAARKFGVRSAMPGFIAVKLCPSLVFVKPNYQKYVDVAKDVRSVFAKYDPAFRAASLDEAYLDLTDCLVQRGVLPQTPPSLPSDQTHRAPESSLPAAPQAPTCTSMIKGFHPTLVEMPAPKRAADLPQLSDEEEPSNDRSSKQMTHASMADTAQAAIEAVVAEMRGEIHRITRITASAGIGPNPMLAKIASDFNKPNGQYFVPFNRTGVMAFMGALLIRKIPFIGKVSEALLGQAFQVTNGAELLSKLPEIYMTLSENQRSFLHRSCLGIADTSREEGESHRRKSVSQERTFRDCSDPSTLRSKCKEISAKVSAMMQKGDPARGTSWEFFGSSDDGGVGWQDTAARASHIDQQDATPNNTPTHTGAEGTVGQDASDAGEDGVPRVPYRGKTVTLKLKLSNFKVLSRQVQLPRLTNNSDTIAAAALELLDKEISHAAAGCAGIAGCAGRTSPPPRGPAAAVPLGSRRGNTPPAATAPLTLRLMGVRMSALVFDDEIENSPLVQFLQGGTGGQGGAAREQEGSHSATGTRPSSFAVASTCTPSYQRPTARGKMDAFMVPAHILAQERPPNTATTSSTGGIIELDEECDSQEVMVLDSPSSATPQPDAAAAASSSGGSQKRGRHPPSSHTTATCTRPGKAPRSSAAKSAGALFWGVSATAPATDAVVLDLTMSPPPTKPQASTENAHAVAAPPKQQQLCCPVGIAPATWAALPPSIQAELSHNLPQRKPGAAKCRQAE